MNDSLLFVSEKQITSYKTLLDSDKLIFSKYDEEIANYMMIINNQEVQKKELSESIKNLTKEVKKQKFKKNLFLGCGIATTCFMTYLCIKK